MTEFWPKVLTEFWPKVLAESFGFCFLAENTCFLHFFFGLFWDILGARNGREAAKLPKMVWEAPKKAGNTCFLHFFGLFWDILGARNVQNGLGGPKKAEKTCFLHFFGLYWDILSARNGRGGPKTPAFFAFFFRSILGHFGRQKWSGRLSNCPEWSGRHQKGRKHLLFAFFPDYFGTFWALEMVGEAAKLPKMVWKAQKRPEIVWDAVCARACVCWCLRVLGFG